MQLFWVGYLFIFLYVLGEKISFCFHFIIQTMEGIELKR